MDCKGKKIIVTGGSEGYGFGIAKELKKRGGDVLIVGRTLAKLEKAAAEINARFVAADVGKAADWDRIFAEAGELDILINNAGAGIRITPLTEYTDEEITRSIATNLTAVLYGCRRAGKIMMAKKAGLIINISSICAHYSWPGFTAYTAAKAGVDMASRCLYTELRPYNVRVTAVTPSWGATNFGTASGLQKTDPELAKKMMQPDEMGRLIAALIEAPDHLEFPEVMVQPTVQEIIPF